MPTATYTPLATITLGSSASSVTFSNIPNTYRDLICILNGTTTGNADILGQFNGSNSGYHWVYMGGNGSSTASGSAATQTQLVLDAYFWRSSEPATLVIQVMDYSATDKQKTVLSRNNVAGGGVDAFANRWGNTNAITSFSLFPSNYAFSSGTTASLYGIVA